MITTILSGLALGSVYTLVAVGFNLTWLTTKAVNFAQGGFMVAGMFLTVYCYHQGIPVALTFLLLALVGSLVAVVEYLVAVRPVMIRGEHSELVTTVGALTVIEGVILLLVTEEAERVPFFATDTPVVSFLGGRVAPSDLVLIVLAIVIALSVHLWTTRTRTGLAAMALAEDREAATLVGVNTRWFSLLSFAASGVLGFAIAPIVGPKTFAIVTLAAVLSIKGFVVLAVGGVGSNLGALIGGIGVGTIELLVARFLSADLQNLSVFVVFITVMLLRPRGLFGQQSERYV